MTHTITLIPGDGIGPEITSAVVQIVEAAGLDVEWEPQLAGAGALEKHGSTLPAERSSSNLTSTVNAGRGTPALRLTRSVESFSGSMHTVIAGR